jgi:hypothetical protein
MVRKLLSLIKILIIEMFTKAYLSLVNLIKSFATPLSINTNAKYLGLPQVIELHYLQLVALEAPQIPA